MSVANVTYSFIYASPNRWSNISARQWQAGVRMQVNYACYKQNYNAIEKEEEDDDNDDDD